MQQQVATLSEEAAKEAASSGRVVKFVWRGSGERYCGTITPLPPGSSRFSYRFTGQKEGGQGVIVILVNPQDLIFPEVEGKEE